MRRLKTFVVGAAFAALSALPVYATIPAVPMFLPAVPPPAPPPPPPPPAGLTPPAEAKAAGFTTLAANYDFTGQTQSSVYGNNISLGPLSNWLYCSGTYNPTNPQWWVQNFTTPNASPCNAFAMITDSGLSVMDLHWDPSYFPSSYATTMTTQQTFTSYSGGTFFPVSAYTEVKVRFTSGAGGSSNPCLSSNSNCIFGDSWEYSPNGTEWDFIEVYGGGPASDGGCAQVGGGCYPSSVDPTQYHIYGNLVTYDGSQWNTCWYVDNNFVSCSGPQSGSFDSAREYLVEDLGPEGGINTAQPVDMYIQWAHVWSCASSQTTECEGTLYNP